MPILRKIFFLLVVLLAIPLAGQDFFLRYYDNGGNERARFCTVAHDRIVLVGNTTGNALDRLAGVAQFLDLDGNLLQSVRIDTSRRTFLFGVAPLDPADPTAGWLIGGDQNNYETVDDVAFYRLNADAERMGTFGWGNPDEDEQLRNLLALADGTFVAMGNIGTSDLAYARRMDGQGDARWYRTWRVPESQFNVFQDAVELSDGLLLAGYSTPDSRTGKLVLAKFSHDGELLWNYLYEYPNQTDEGIRSITVTPTGELYAVVRVIGPDLFVDALVIHLSATGEVLGQILLSGAGDLVINDSHLTAAGNLLLAGALSVTANGLQALVVELNPAGQIVRQRTVGNARVSSLLDIEPAPTGGYFLAGYGSYCGGDADMLLAYLDDELENARESCLQTVNLRLEVLPATSVSRRTGGEVADREDPSVRIAATSQTNAGVESENCPTLNLDADDSSGSTTNGGFRIAVDCYEEPLPVTDPDVFLNFDQPVPRRILLSLRDQVWTGEEYLNVPPSLAERVTEAGGGTNLAVNALPGDTSEDLLNALREVRYYNDAAQIEPGVRTVLIRMEYECFIGNIVEAEIVLSNGTVSELNLRDTIVCPGEELLVDATTLGAEAYRWSDGAIDSVRTIQEPGAYALTVSGACGSVADSFQVSESPTELTPISDQLDILCATDSLLVNMTVANATYYRWDDGYLGPERSLSGSGTYEVRIGNACTAFATKVKIVAEACCQLYVPNAFSPNGDGVNDRFRPLPENNGCLGLSDWTLRVFNRWGGEVFLSQRSEEGWDGTDKGRPAGNGTYVYHLRYYDGVNYREEQGSLQLLR